MPAWWSARSTAAARHAGASSSRSAERLRISELQKGLRAGRSLRLTGRRLEDADEAESIVDRRMNVARGDGVADAEELEFAGRVGAQGLWLAGGQRGIVHFASVL